MAKLQELDAEPAQALAIARIKLGIRDSRIEVGNIDITRDFLDVRDLVRSQRARHCVPREVVFLDELPRNTTGKILTRELKARFV